MLLFDAPQAVPLSFGIVKRILAHAGIGPDTDDPSIAQSLRIVLPLDTALARRVRAGATSLTDAATSQEQIRFFQQRRATRSYIALADAVVRRIGPVSIEIGRNGDIDAPSREFLRVASDVAGWDVTYREGAVEARRSDAWSAEERSLLAALEPDVLTDNLDEIWTAAFEYINVGDAATGVALGRLLAKHEQSPRIWNLLALGCAMLDRTEEAEFFYERWAESGGDLDAVRALYGRAMLAARHHQDGLRSINRAGRLLDEAHSILSRLDDEQRAHDSIVFEEVFNRNGAALVLFRRGHVDEALELLQWGISRLTQTNEKVAIHRSVLMYNLAQCRRQLGDGPGAIEAYERLLEVDPHMPEYHLEAAKCYASEGRLADAERAVRVALDLDDTLAVAWSLLGVYLGRQDRHAAAAEAFAEAARLQPRDITHRLDEAYNRILAKDTTTARHLLLGLEPEVRRDVERHAALLAEVHLRDGDRDAGVAVIEAALERHPRSTPLATNREQLLAR